MGKHAELLDMVGMAIRVNRGGPEVIVGKLLAAKPDHIVVYTEGGAVYVKTKHIKSVTVNSKDYSDLMPLPCDYVQPKFIDEEDFEKVLEKMEGRWIQVNRGGPDKVEGILVKSCEDTSMVVAGNEVIHVMNYHIRSVSFAPQKQADDKEKDEKNSVGHEAKK